MLESESKKSAAACALPPPCIAPPPVIQTLVLPHARPFQVLAMFLVFVRRGGFSGFGWVCFPVPDSGLMRPCGSQ